MVPNRQSGGGGGGVRCCYSAVMYAHRHYKKLKVLMSSKKPESVGTPLFPQCPLTAFPAVLLLWPQRDACSLLRSKHRPELLQRVHWSSSSDLRI